ncbi:MAG: Trp family transcriptional regulator, partial [Chloroflexi bacterium]|nr:Trp family transcriptional regulator [Chloroflexota bacterium]
MARISKYRLDPALEEEMFRQFWLSVSLLRDAEAVSSVFSDLLSETEEIMLAKRFTVALLLLRGKKPADIKMTLHVSNSTICSVHGWLKNAKPCTRRVLEIMVEEARWQKLLVVYRFQLRFAVWLLLKLKMYPARTLALDMHRAIVFRFHLDIGAVLVLYLRLVALDIGFLILRGSSSLLILFRRMLLILLLLLLLGG